MPWASDSPGRPGNQRLAQGHPSGPGAKLGTAGCLYSSLRLHVFLSPLQALLGPEEEPDQGRPKFLQPPNVSFLVALGEGAPETHRALHISDAPPTWACGLLAGTSCLTPKDPFT